MSQANPSPTMPSPALGEDAPSPAVTLTRRGTPRRGHARHAARKRPHSRSEEKDWRKVADRGLEIVICIGHIVGVVMLVADHLF